MTTSIFFLGATGYIGGAVLVAFQSAFPSPQYSYKALVRKSSSIAAVEALGVTVVQGSHSDLDLIRDEASTADIVVNCADSDDVPLTEAVLEGMKKKKERTGGGLPLLLHTSGTGILTDKPSGEFTSWAEKIWNDNDPSDIKRIAPEAPHRNVDIKIIEAGEKALIAPYIIAPSTIYGVGLKNPGNKFSIQVPLAISTAIEKKKAVYIGKGTNRWNNVHIDDLTDLYVLVLQNALNTKTEVNPWETYYFGSVGEHVWGDVIQAIARSLHKRGLVDSPEATSISVEEAGKDYASLVGHNSRSVAERGKNLGWKPHRKSLEDNLEEDVEAVVARHNK